MSVKEHVQEVDLGQFKDLLRRTCGFDFEHEREASLTAGIKQRMSLSGIEERGQYLARLTTDQNELRRLVEVLTNNETYFLREPEHLRLAAECLIPELLAVRPEKTLAILSAGCSTGEEPYSLAMLLQEPQGLDCSRRFSLTGVDMDESVLAKARLGIYGSHSFRGVEDHFIHRHFEPLGRGYYQLKAEIRGLVNFYPLNLLTPPYPPFMSGLDIILYRNVSIYFAKPVRAEIFRRLASCLNPGGYLLVGAAETLPHDLGVLTLVERQSLYLFQKTGGSKIVKSSGPSRADSRVKSFQERDFGHGSKPRTIVPRPDEPPVRPRDKIQERILVDQALGLGQKGCLDEALNMLSGLLSQSQPPLAARCLQASLLLSANRVSEAKKACQDILAQDPNCQEASLMLAMAARQDGSGDQALDFLRQAIYLDPKCWLAHFQLAEMMFALGEKKRARGGYESVLRLLPGQSSDNDRRLFPLAYNAGQYLAVCRHKLDLLG